MTDDEPINPRGLQLLIRHKQTLWKRCWRYADSDPDRCADLVQEVSVVILLRTRTLPPDISPDQERLWVSNVARTTLHNLHRRPALDQQTLREALDDLYDTSRQQARQQAAEIIETLPSDQRTIMQLRLDGYSNREIAARIGISPSAVGKRIRSIIKTLKQKYNP